MKIDINILMSYIAFNIFCKINGFKPKIECDCICNVLRN